MSDAWLFEFFVPLIKSQYWWNH